MTGSSAHSRSAPKADAPLLTDTGQDEAGDAGAVAAQ